MSQPEPSSQDSTDTQEIYSQDSFNEIWQSLGRTFSNPEKLIEGLAGQPGLNRIPFTIEYQDQESPENFVEITYEERKLLPNSPTFSQQPCDLLQPSIMVNPGENFKPIKFHINFPPFDIIIGKTCVQLQQSLEGTSTLNEKLYEPVELSPILPNKSYPGLYDFCIEFEPNTDPITKATPWVYVPDRQKLFVKMQCVCPILFKIKGTPPPGTGIRGILTYKRPEHYKEIVLRCPNHKNTSKDDRPYQDHVMRCENASTIYQTCPKTERLSLFVPLSDINPVAGEGSYKELFKFTCFNSCVGGMNRRPTYLLLRLECGGTLYGHAVVEIRICASPGRDSTEKEISGNQKNGKNTDKRTEPTSTTDAVIPMPLCSAHSPGSSPTAMYPPRASVLMSTSKDPCSAPEPFQFPPVQTQSVKRQQPVGKDGYVIKKLRKTYHADSPDDEIFTITVRGRERYEMLQKISDGLHMLDDLRPPEQRPNRHAANGVESSLVYKKIQPKPQTVEIKKEQIDSSSQCDVSPQCSQECVNELSQLSRTSSDASSQSSTQNLPEYTAVKVTMKRTVSIKNPSVPKAALMPDTEI